MEAELIFGLIGFILSITILVAFFSINRNVREIKNGLLPALEHLRKQQKQQWRVNYYVNKSLPGHEQEKIKALTAIIYTDLVDPGLNKADRDKLYNDLKVLYGPVFEREGSPFPPNLSS